MIFFFFFKQNTAYEMRISDWSSDVCSSDLRVAPYRQARGADHQCAPRLVVAEAGEDRTGALVRPPDQLPRLRLSEGGAAVLARTAPGSGVRARTDRKSVV